MNKGELYLNMTIKYIHLSIIYCLFWDYRHRVDFNKIFIVDKAKDIMIVI